MPLVSAAASIDGLRTMRSDGVRPPVISTHPRLSRMPVSIPRRVSRPSRTTHTAEPGCSPRTSEVAGTADRAHCPGLASAVVDALPEVIEAARSDRGWILETRAPNRKCLECEV